MMLAVRPQARSSITIPSPGTPVTKLPWSPLTKPPRTPVRATQSPKTPVKETPSSKIPVRGTTSPKMPVRTIQSPKMPAKEAPLHKTPVKEIPSPKTPVRGTSSPKTSLREAPSLKTPIRVARSPKTQVTPLKKTPESLSPRKPLIQTFPRAKVAGENKRKRSASPNRPLARSTSGSTSPAEDKPGKRAALTIPCAGTGCDQTDGLNWICKKCTTNLEYGFDDNVYCECGKSALSSLEFKCTSPQHGKGFLQHDESSLTAFTSRQFQQEFNMLMLGEIGAGKSTMINACTNLLTYNSLKEAEAGTTQAQIPIKFTAFDETFNETEITCGSGDDPNEIQNEGQSTTQFSRIHQIQDGNTMSRFIDTPGFGDERGTEEDKKSFENILSTICHLDEIHAILIFLKPNSTKVNPTFQFCIKELLQHLPKAASNNIIFCFSNTRGTMYRPGRAISELKALLQEYKEAEINITPNNVFRFDNEAERFLACIKSGHLFTDDEHENYSSAWGKSTGDIKKLLGHVQQLGPHSIPEKLKRDQASDLVAKMPRPIAESIRMLDANKSIAEDEKRLIEKTPETIAALTKLQMRRVGLKIRKCKHPKTVCSHEDCVTRVEQNNITTTEYSTVCHSLCKLKGVAADSIGDPRLKKCVAFVDEVCKRKKCGHPLRNHLHVYNDYTRVDQPVTIKSPKRGITAAELKKSMIEEKNELIKAFENELRRILSASPRFSYFLGGEEDGFEMHIKHVIQEDQMKVKPGEDRVILDALKTSLKSYLKEKKILENRIRVGCGVPPKAVDIQILVKELTKLEHSGKVLRDSLQCFNYDSGTVFSDTVLIPPKQKFISELDVAAEE